MRTYFSLFLAAFFWVGEAGAQEYPQVREVPTLNLTHTVAVVLQTQFGPVIFYNPEICRKMGPPACNFARVHEYGHIALGHVNKAAKYAHEVEADCWAAQRATISEVLAAVKLFEADGMKGSLLHGTGFERAERIKKCRFEAAK